MYLAISLTAVLLLIATGFYFGRARALNAVDGVYGALHSLPNYYGAYVALWCGLPALLLLILWLGGQKRWLKAWCWPNCRPNTKA